jgi:hypothetical protein
VQVCPERGINTEAPQEPIPANSGFNAVLFSVSLQAHENRRQSVRRIQILLVVAGLSIGVFAEFRIWTDAKGNFLEAELAGTDGKQIILQKRDGKKILLSPLALSEDDQKYLRGKISDELFDPAIAALDLEKPPRLEIDFKKVTDTKNNINSGSYRDIEMYSAVTVKKKNREPYSGTMKAELYVIGHCQRDGRYVLLDKTKHEFSFDGKKRETSFQTSHITLREYRYNSNYSTEYKGYLVVILDQEGEIMMCQSSSSKFEENYRRLAKLEKGSYFTKHYEVSHVDSDGRYY